MKTKIEGTLH